MADKKDSQRQEARLAKSWAGTVNSGSGSGWIRKSDVRTEYELVEAKITSSKSYSLKDAELQKNYDYALMDGRIPIFMVEFQGTGNKWVIMQYDDYETLREGLDIGNETTECES
jgi:hypothetical protein